MRRAFMFVIVMGISALTLAQDGAGRAVQLTSKDQTRQLSEKFLQTLITSRTYDAFQVLRNAGGDATTDIDAARETTEQLLNGVRNTMGKAIGFELIDTKSLGESFIRYDYLYRMERSALHFRIVFYKGANAYMPVQLYFEQDLQQLFYDLGK